MLQVFKFLKQHQNSNVNAVDIDGNTMLHQAVKNENFTPEEKIKTLEILLDKGLDPSIRNKKNETVWHLAIANQSKGIINFLLAREIYFEDSVALYIVKNEHNKMSEWANQSQMSDNNIQKVENEMASFIEWIISKDLNLGCLNRLRMGMLLLAIDYNVLHILPALLKHIKGVDYLEYETERTLLQIFLENNASLRDTHKSKPTETWYSKYSERYTLSIVKNLLDRGVSPEAVDKHGNTALHVAIKREENMAIVEMLIERSKNVDCKNVLLETPFSIAIYKWGWLRESETNDYAKICLALISKGADVNGLDKETSPLFEAVRTLNLPAVELLQENGADFRVITFNRRTLLHSLVDSLTMSSFPKPSKETMIKLFDILVNNHCNVDAKDDDGKTALHIAADSEDVEIIQMLVERGVYIEARNDRRETPLRQLISSGVQETDAVELLLTHGANANAKDIRGYAPLHTTSDSEMLRLLLECGADFSARVNAGHSVLRLALWREYYKDGFKPEDIPCRLNRQIDYASEGVQILFKHWIKLHAANLPYFTGFEYEELIAKNKYKQYQEKYLKEIQILKTTFIDSRTSLYSLLRMELNRRRAYVYNEKLQELLKSWKLEEKFPEYSILIFANYREAMTRVILLAPAKKIWHHRTKISLPEICIEHIFSFLSNADLFDFIE